jgi:hypothetical protein
MTFHSELTRREFLRWLQAGALTAPLAWFPTCSRRKNSSAAPGAQADEQLRDEIQRASFDFFWNESGPVR